MALWAWVPVVALAAAPAVKKIRVAVPPIHAGNGVTDTTASLLTEVMAKAAADVKPDRLEVMTPAVMSGLLGLERQKELMGCKEDTACLVEVGSALGAEAMVTGTLGKLGNTWVLDVTLVDTQHNRPSKSTEHTITGAEDNLLPAAREAGGEMGRALVAEYVAQADAAPPAPLPAPATPAAAPAPSVVAAPAPPPTPRSYDLAARPDVSVAATTPDPSPSKLASATPSAAPVKAAFPGAVIGFPYDRYPAPVLDAAAVQKYERKHP